MKVYKNIFLITKARISMMKKYQRNKFFFANILIELYISNFAIFIE